MNINDQKIRSSDFGNRDNSGLASLDFQVFKNGFDSGPRKRYEFASEQERRLFDEGWASSNRAIV